MVIIRNCCTFAYLWGVATKDKVSVKLATEPAFPTIKLIRSRNSYSMQENTSVWS
jgi:hypothetical protein